MRMSIEHKKIIPERSLALGAISTLLIVRQVVIGELTCSLERGFDVRKYPLPLASIDDWMFAKGKNKPPGLTLGRHSLCTCAI
jgi:hypothetical protein